MEPNLDHVPGGWVGALTGLLAAIGGAYAIWQGRHKAAASDRADIASDNARGGTYEMLARENDSLTAENAALREKVSTLERIDAMRESRFINLRRDFAIYKQMVNDGLPKELIDKYAQNSTLADLAEGPN